MSLERTFLQLFAHCKIYGRWDMLQL